MASLRYILPALAIVGSAAAADCSASATTTLQNGGDARALGTCQTFSGSIAIATSTTDNIDLSGIKEITGSLSADSAPLLPEIIASDLQDIKDTFSLQNMTILASLNMPKLNSVKTIDWNALPALQSLGTNIQMVNSLSIQNTQLNTLDGINLLTVDTLLLANNRFLGKVDMQLDHVSNSMIIQSNGRNVSASFPNLMWANNMTISNVSSFDAPSLASVNGSVGFYSDYFTNLSAANLTEVGSSLAIYSCPQLTNISFPMLKKVGGGLTVANNTALKSITGFPVLATIGGALDYYGNFTNVSLPAITSVAGAFNIKSTSDLTDICNTFKGQSGPNNVIKGTFSCEGNQVKPDSGPASGTGGASPSSSPSGVAVNVQIPAMTGVLGVVAAIFGML